MPQRLRRDPSWRVPRSASGWASPIERAGAGDLMQLTYESRSAGNQVGAVLVLAPDRPLDLPAVQAAVAERVAGVPRLRQRLRGTPPGCGRPIWVDDPAFDIRRHVTAAVSPPPGDELALLDLAAATMGVPLPRDRPLWAATLVSDLAGGRMALLLRFHHVLADGIGGLAVLAHLVDGFPPPPAPPFPRPAPAAADLAADALAARLRAVRTLPAGLRRLASAASQLGSGMAARAPRCSFNRPTGPRRRLAVARTDLATARTAAHAQGGTVNDVLLTAVCGAVHTALRDRGEVLDRLVVSVPVSGHTAGETGGVTNRVGAVPVSLPASGDPQERLRSTVGLTRVLRAGDRGATAALLEPVFRLLGSVGVLRWYIDRQRRVNTFVTNLRGPAERLHLLGAPVTSATVVSGLAGNVAVAFGALSYAGTLAVTVVTDPDAGVDADDLATRVEHEFAHLRASP